MAPAPVAPDDKDAPQKEGLIRRFTAPRTPSPPEQPESRPAAERPGTTVAVFRPLSDGVDPKLAQLLMQAVIGELVKLRGIDAIGPQEMETLLTAEGARQLASCSEGPCAVSLAKSAGASKAVTGSMVRLGGAVVVNWKLLDLSGPGARIEGAYSGRAEGGEEKALDLAGDAARTLFPQQAAPAAAADDAAAKKAAKGEKPMSESTRKFHRIAAFTSLGLSAATFGVTIYFAMEAKTIYEKLDAGRYPPEKIYSKVQEEKQAESIQTFTLVGGSLFAVLSGYFFYKGYFAKTGGGKSNTDQYQWLNVGVGPPIDFVTAFVDERGALLAVGGRF
jgi:hypothetical protein